QHTGAGSLRQRVGPAHRVGAFVGRNVVAGNRGTRAATNLNCVGRDVLRSESGNRVIRNRAAAAGVIDDDRALLITGDRDVVDGKSSDLAQRKRAGAHGDAVLTT